MLQIFSDPRWGQLIFLLDASTAAPDTFTVSIAEEEDELGTDKAKDITDKFEMISEKLTITDAGEGIANIKNKIR